MIIQNCNGKAIYVSLLFPKLGKKVKKIDIIAYPHKDDVHPSNPVPGDGTAYLNINIEDYLVKSSKAPQIYDQYIKNLLALYFFYLNGIASIKEIRG